LRTALGRSENLSQKQAKCGGTFLWTQLPGGIRRRIYSPMLAWASLSSEKVEEHLPSKCKAMSSISYHKKKKEKWKRRKEKEHFS
jgi:hypothetical protein